MKLVIQRVKKASVKVKKDDEVVGRIGVGLFILVGFGMEDTKEDVEKMVKKVLNLRVMVDSEGKMNLSIMDTSKEILVVSQTFIYKGSGAWVGTRFVSFICDGFNSGGCES